MKRKKVLLNEKGVHEWVLTRHTYGGCTVTGIDETWSGTDEETRKLKDRDAPSPSVL